MKKCCICGIVKKVSIKCSRCEQEVCLDCFYVDRGLCPDCMTLEYNEIYAEKIKAYEDEQII
jgi:hypothetical protein